jgi:hypothetical protein
MLCLIDHRQTAVFFVGKLTVIHLVMIITTCFLDPATEGQSMQPEVCHAENPAYKTNILWYEFSSYGITSCGKD